ncbi:MAG: site-specific integrase, partial [Patescibacteria group bacterium]|nr:site-specific integrase [Patescibacteria group bacterium]
MNEKWYNLYNLEPQFKNFLLAENVSPITLKNYLSDIRYFLGWIQSFNNKEKIKNEAEINKIINKETIIKYLQYLIENKLPKKTINRRLSTIRKLCSFLISQGWIKENPAKKISNIQNDFHKEILALKSPKYNIYNKIKQLSLDKFNQIKNSFKKKSTFDFSFQKYIGFIILLIFMSALGAGIYNQFFQKSEKSFAYPPSPNIRAGRILSFQGRLTDTLSNPITTATNVTFKLYNVPTGGTALYTAGACSITPDQDGIFNVLIGGSGYSPTPPQQVCGTEIPASIFTENANVYLGITIASDNEMTPRQQIANVGYAINAETLQGLPPGINTSTIPYINQDGNLLIGASSAGIRSIFTSADFTLSSAKATIIQSAGAGDIILQATQSGILKFRVGGLSDTNNIMVLNNSGAEIFGNIYANSGQIRLGNFTSSPSPIGSGSLYYNSTNNKIYYYNGTSWVEVGSGAGGGDSLWEQTLGVLYPKNSTLDLAIGGTSTSSAKFSFININSGTPTFKMNQASNIDLVNSNINALNIEGGLMNFDTQNSRIGIGTTNPQAKLDILGDIFSSGKGKIDYITDYSNENYGIDPAGTTNFGGYSLKITAGALLAADSGNVGIGTVNPSQKLEVAGNTYINNGQLRLGNFSSTPTAIGAGTMIFNSTTNNFQCWNGTAWFNCGGTLYSTSGNVNDGSYLTVTHNLANNDLIYSAWVYDNITNKWQSISLDDGNAGSHDTSNTNLRALWKLEETSGNLIDSTTNNNTLFNGNGNSSALYSQIGKKGNAIELDGVNDYFSAPDSVSLSPTSQISLGAWIQFKEAFAPHVKENDFALLDKGDYRLIFNRQTGKLDFEINDSASTSWTMSYNGSKSVIFSLAVYNGKLYAGQGLSTGDGDVLVFDGNTWSISYDGAQEMIRSLAVYNGKLYAGQGSGTGDGDIFVFDGNTWSLSYDGAKGLIVALAVYNGRLYAGQGGGTGDGDVLVFDGNTWSISYDGAQEYIFALAVYNGRLYAGQGSGTGDGDIFVFDGNTWSLSYNGAQELIHSLAVYNGKLYAGQGDSTGDGDIFVFDGNTWSLAYDGTKESIRTFSVYNGKLYAGQGY